jgi:hypothetical protein
VSISKSSSPGNPEAETWDEETKPDVSIKAKRKERNGEREREMVEKKQRGIGAKQSLSSQLFSCVFLLPRKKNIFRLPCVYALDTPSHEDAQG